MLSAVSQGLMSGRALLGVSALRGCTEPLPAQAYHHCLLGLGYSWSWLKEAVFAFSNLPLLSHKEVQVRCAPMVPGAGTAVVPSVGDSVGSPHQSHAGTRRPSAGACLQ